MHEYLRLFAEQFRRRPREQDQSRIVCRGVHRRFRVQAVALQKFPHPHLIHRSESVYGGIVLRDHEIVDRPVFDIFEVVHENGDILIPPPDKIM